METQLMFFRDTIILVMSEETRPRRKCILGEDVGVFGGDFGTLCRDAGRVWSRTCP